MDTECLIHLDKLHGAILYIDDCMREVCELVEDLYNSTNNGKYNGYVEILKSLGTEIKIIHEKEEELRNNYSIERLNEFESLLDSILEKMDEINSKIQNL